MLCTNNNVSSGAISGKWREKKVDREKGSDKRRENSGVGWVEEKRGEKRGRERKERGARGRKRERREDEKGSKHLSLLKYRKHENIESLSDEVQLSLYSRCHYLVLSLNSSSSALYNDK